MAMSTPAFELQKLLKQQQKTVFPESAYNGTSEFLQSQLFCSKSSGKLLQDSETNSKCKEET
jgi:hypothetical protein